MTRRSLRKEKPPKIRSPRTVRREKRPRRRVGPERPLPNPLLPPEMIPTPTRVLETREDRLDKV